MDKRSTTVSLVIGGARSGKSRHSEELACLIAPQPIYLATAEAFDDEMVARITMHRKQREGRFLKTVEEPLELASALRRVAQESPVVLIDCVTVWLGNLMYREGLEDSYRQIDQLYEYLENPLQHVVIVSNEVGQGIVPADPMSRHFRDHAGRMNQELARLSDRVVLMVAGIPVTIRSNR